MEGKALLVKSSLDVTQALYETERLMVRAQTLLHMETNRLDGVRLVFFGCSVGQQRETKNKSDPTISFPTALPIYDGAIVGVVPG